MTENNIARLEKLMALVLINSLKSSTVEDKAHQLSLAGFTNIEIADLIETNTTVIAASLYNRKKKKAKKKDK